MITKLVSEPGFDEFVTQERPSDREHGWTLMQVPDGGEVQEVMGTWAVWADRVQAQEEVDRLNRLNEAERDAVLLRGKAVLAYYG